MHQQREVITTTLMVCCHFRDHMLLQISTLQYLQKMNQSNINHNFNFALISLVSYSVVIETKVL